MTVLSAQSIKRLVKEAHLKLVDPFYAAKIISHGMSYGLSVAGYDIRIGAIDRKGFHMGHDINPDTGEIAVTAGLHKAKEWVVKPGVFILLSSMERIALPTNVIGFVHDKSTLARRGLALQNTVLEPGWEGHITLELSNHGIERVRIEVGMPIAQLVFHWLDEPAEDPYTGKYQHQGPEPVHAISEPNNGGI